jgi:hypothetical protein
VTSPQTKPDGGGSRAVVIGSAVYDDEKIKGYPAIGRSAECIARLLQRSPMWGPESCRLILNPATQHDICCAIVEADGEVGNGGTLLVYYIGHGEYWTDAAPPDVYLALRTSMCRQEWSFLGSRYVYRVMRESEAVRKVLILDCCNSGLVDGVLGERAHPQWMEEIERHGTCVLTATKRESWSQGADAEDTDKQYTAFSGCLAGILENGIEDGPHDLTVLDIFNALDHRLPQRGHPRPEIISRRYGAKIPVYENKTPGQHPRPPQRARLTSLAPDELAAVWAGHEPIPGLPSDVIEDYLPEFVARHPAAEVAQLVHHLHGLGPERVSLWVAQVLTTPPEQIGAVAAALCGCPCPPCAGVAQHLEDAAIGTLSRGGLIEYRRGLHRGYQP